MPIPSPKTWTREDVLRLWPQAKGELRGFQKALERNAGITAEQLGMAIQLAEAEYERLVRQIVPNAQG